MFRQADNLRLEKVLTSYYGVDDYDWSRTPNVNDEVRGKMP